MTQDEQRVPCKLTIFMFAILWFPVSPIHAAQHSEDKPGIVVAWPKIQQGFSFATSNDAVPIDVLHVFEDGVEQTGAIISKDLRPASVLIMVDVSTSMKPVFGSILNGVRAMVAAAQPNDEFAVVTFSWEAFLEQSFTEDRTRLVETLSGLKHAGGSTALYDAADASIKQFGNARGLTKRAIILFSDGHDLTSKLSEKKFIRTLKALGAPSMYIVCPAPQSKQGVDAAVRMSTASGGMTFTSNRSDDVNSEATQAIHIIDGMSSLEYSSSHTRADGRLHRIEVRSVPGSEASKTKFVFRQEYYAPSQ